VAVFDVCTVAPVSCPQQPNALIITIVVIRTVRL
jgi:hypothetical protein